MEWKIIKYFLLLKNKTKKIKINSNLRTEVEKAWKIEILNEEIFYVTIKRKNIFQVFP